MRWPAGARAACEGKELSVLKCRDPRSGFGTFVCRHRRDLVFLFVCSFCALLLAATSALFRGKPAEMWLYPGLFPFACVLLPLS